MRRDASGKVTDDANAITAGKVIEKGVEIGGTIAVGKVLSTPSAPRTLNSSAALPQIEAASTTQAGRLRQVNTGGLRNEVSLTEAQKAEALAYAKSLGMAEENVVFSENMNTSYKLLFGQDRLYIGTDVLPAAPKPALPANSRISMKGAIAHEVTGHKTAELAGKTNPNELLEEVQASIRAARFAPNLSTTERVTLIRDGLERLKKAGLTIREVKGQLWITKEK